ncbi:MAG: hypothetical protein HFF05_06340 [Oscillospiraceae bacterium]|nr:hypothetical protein [Oscillospiraceae bacterium]MCI8761471.1 hypothetical protein [Oscillospiraceae bacterium]
MADLQEQLQAILGDPEAMGQITAIARALTGGGPIPQAPPVNPEPEAQDVEFVPVDDPAPEPEPAQAEPMPDLSALLGMLGAGGGMDIDPRLLQLAVRVFSEYSAQDNEKVALLTSLKPFLRAERLEKMEKAEKIARLSRMVRLAIQLLKEEGEGHV